MSIRARLVACKLTKASYANAVGFASKGGGGKIEMDTANATLPPEAHRPSFTMHLRGGRDQVASCVFQLGWRSFERPFPEYFYACARRFPGLIADIGANTGFYSLLGACASGANRVVAFEPDLAILEALKENLAYSNVTEQVSAHELALSSAPGRAAFYVPTQEHGLIETSSSLEASFKTAHSETRTVEVETLDRVLAWPEFADQRVSLIKVDVEGHESAVLSGANATVERWRPILFVEVLSAAKTPFFDAFLLQHGYVDMPMFTTGSVSTNDTVKYHPDAWNHAFVPKEEEREFACILT